MVWVWMQPLRCLQLYCRHGSMFVIPLFPSGLPQLSCQSLCFRARCLLSGHRHLVDLPLHLRNHALWLPALFFLWSPNCCRCPPPPLIGILVSLSPGVWAIDSQVLFVRFPPLTSIDTARKLSALNHIRTEQMVGTDLAEEFRSTRRRCFHDNQG